MTFVPSSLEQDLPLAQISHSVVHPDFIAREVAARYPMQGKVEAWLLYRGMNDVYLVKDDHTKYALRVWRKTYRDVDDVAYELDYLAFLKDRNFPASVAVPQHDGTLYWKAATSEGRARWPCMTGRRAANSAIC
jgi:Ser/Thr protein kinase RdoA (MazF antagonist)